MYLERQRFDALDKSLYCFRELGVLLEHLYEQARLFRRKRLPFLARTLQSLTMLRIGERMSGITVGLAGLRQQYERGRICRLQTKGEIEENKWVDIEGRKPEDVDEYPNRYDDGLCDEKCGSAKKASERLSLQGKPVVPKN